MCAIVNTSGAKWAFSKADREAAYKQLPLAHPKKILSLVTLRNQVTPEWMAFPPKALLFGPSGAVLHYSCFSRLLSVSPDQIFGVTLIEYSGKVGALSPTNFRRAPLERSLNSALPSVSTLKQRRRMSGG